MRRTDHDLAQHLARIGMRASDIVRVCNMTGIQTVRSSAAVDADRASHRKPDAHAFFQQAPVPAHEIAWGFSEAQMRGVRIGRRDILLHSGTRFEALYIIRAGSCKLVVTSPDGEEHIVAFCLPGEVIGLEALASGIHETTVHALEPLTCWRIEAQRINRLLHDDGAFTQALVHALSLNAGRGMRGMLLLGTMAADQRLASFLLDLAERYQRLGFSGSAFELRMTRTEIGDHLGLSTETVSRTLSRLRADGLVSVSGRSVRLRDLAALGRILVHGA